MNEIRLSNLLKRLDGKEALKIVDLQNILSLGRDRACKTMREIKANHDRLGVKGVVHLSDYLLWAEK